MKLSMFFALAMFVTPAHASDNILVILADDLGVDNVGCYGLGSDLPSTPTIDAMAASGVRFQTCWANPVCSPSRSTLLTGLYANRTGVGGAVFAPTQTPGMNPNEQSLPKILGQMGYATGAFGKWHLSQIAIDPVTHLPMHPESGGLDHPNVFGFQHYAGNLMSMGPTNYYGSSKIVNGSPVTVPVTTYNTSDIVDDTLAFIGAQTGPWFAYVAFNAPHSPFQGPPSSLHSVPGVIEGVTPTNPTDQRLYYRAMVEAMDTEMARLLSGVDLGSTTVFFLGDNGTPGEVTVAPFNPAHAKNRLWDGGIHVPLVVTGSCVTVAPGTVDTSLVSLVDVFQTAADISGTSPTSDGLSFLPQLATGSPGNARFAVFSESFLPLSPPGYCETQAGGGVPGVVLSMCGEAIQEGSMSTLAVSGLEPGAAALFAGSGIYQPQPLYGGSFVLGGSFQDLFLVFADAQGEVSVQVPGTGVLGGVIVDYYIQVLASASNQYGATLSNAVNPVIYNLNNQFHLVAARDDRFKLIWMPDPSPSMVTQYGAAELLYDLSVDPFETTNLLASPPLSPEAQAAYDSLMTFSSTNL